MRNYPKTITDAFNAGTNGEPLKPGPSGKRQARIAHRLGRIWGGELARENDELDRSKKAQLQSVKNVSRGVNVHVLDAVSGAARLPNSHGDKSYADWSAGKPVPKDRLFGEIQPGDGVNWSVGFRFGAKVDDEMTGMPLVAPIGKFHVESSAGTDGGLTTEVHDISLSVGSDYDDTLQLGPATSSIRLNASSGGGEGVSGVDIAINADGTLGRIRVEDSMTQFDPGKVAVDTNIDELLTGLLGAIGQTVAIHEGLQSLTNE